MVQNNNSQNKNNSQNNNSVQNKNNTFSDLTIISVWAITTFILIAISGSGNVYISVYIRTILSIPMTLFIPGYLLAAALFPRKDDIGIVERIALSLGFSIVAISILGLLLNFSFGIRLFPILIILCIYTIVLILITIYRRKRLSDNARFSIQYPWNVSWRQ